MSHLAGTVGTLRTYYQSHSIDGMKGGPPLSGSLEYAVMVELWERGAATTREVYERLGGPAGLAYTTIATVLDRLHSKGCVSRLRLGKAFSYRPAIARADVDRERVRDTLIRLMGDDPLARRRRGSARSRAPRRTRAGDGRKKEGPPWIVRSCSSRWRWRFAGRRSSRSASCGCGSGGRPASASSSSARGGGCGCRS